MDDSNAYGRQQFEECMGERSVLELGLASVHDVERDAGVIGEKTHLVRDLDFDLVLSSAGLCGLIELAQVQGAPVPNRAYEKMQVLEYYEGLLLSDNELETFADTTEFVEVEEEACRALGLDLVESFMLSVQQRSAKGFVKQLLRRRIDFANDADMDRESG